MVRTSTLQDIRRRIEKIRCHANEKEESFIFNIVCGLLHRDELSVDELNQMFREPVVSAQTGGGGGGGASVTETGNDIVRLYRDMERRAYGASTPEIRSLARLLTPPDVKLH